MKSILLGFILLSFGVYGQKKLTGVIKNKETNFGIDAAQIQIIETGDRTYSNLKGEFIFEGNFPENIQLKVGAVGFQTEILNFSFSNSNAIEIKLTEKHVDLEEITVSTGANVMQNKSPFHVETRKLSDLNGVATMNLGEAIAKIPGVYQSSLGNGISKPVIRGLQGMRVVTLLNGLRIEGQQWGGDHGMGLSEIGIGSVEVIKGPASLLYGADALGGVLYFSDEPYAATNTRSLSVQSLYQSNTQGGSVRFLYKESRKKLRWLIGGSYSNHADFQLPSGKFAKNSRFDESVLKSALSFNGKNSVHHLRYAFNATVTGIPGHTHDSSAVFSDFQVIDQKRKYELPAQFFQNHFLSFDNKWFFKSSDLQFFVGATSNRLIEYDEKVTIPSLSMRLNNGLYSMKWNKKWSNSSKLTIGIQGMAQNNANAQNASDILIPNANTFDNGMFANWVYDWNRWIFQAGIRYDLRILKSFETFEINNPITKSYSAPNAAIGLVYNTENLTFRTNISSGFRAPHLTELLANGFHHGALRYEIGDVNLKPEKATQLDLTFEYKNEHLALVVNPYVNYMTNYIYLQPIDSLVDGIPAFNFEQMNAVLFYGSDFGVHYHPHFAHNLHVESNFSWINTFTQSDSSISLLPPSRLNTSLRYSFNVGKKFQLKDFIVQHTFMAAQNKVAFNELPTKAYNLVNVSLNASINLKQTISLAIGCKNIFNEQFIDHLSRLKNIEMPGMGRNFYLSLNFLINQNLKSNKL
jgi:iron complex outermembrane receptor protein